jgi:hypothetical protein
VLSGEGKGEKSNAAENLPGTMNVLAAAVRARSLLSMSSDWRLSGSWGGPDPWIGVEAWYSGHVEHRTASEL